MANGAVPGLVRFLAGCVGAGCGGVIVYLVVLDKLGQLGARMFWTAIVEGNERYVQFALGRATFWLLLLGVVIGAVIGIVIATRLEPADPGEP